MCGFGCVQACSREPLAALPKPWRKRQKKTRGEDGGMCERGGLEKDGWLLDTPEKERLPSPSGPENRSPSFVKEHFGEDACDCSSKERSLAVMTEGAVAFSSLKGDKAPP